MGQISITFQSKDAVKDAIRELAAVLERAKHHDGVEVLNFERGILAAKTDVLDRPFPER